MGFWSDVMTYLLRSSGDTAQESSRRSAAPRYGAYPLYGYSGQSAMCVATVFRCVKLLSESVAVLPVRYLKKRGGIFVDADNPRLDYLLNVQPDRSVSAFDFWRQTVQELLLEGNAYIVPVYNRSSLVIDRLVLCGRGTVSHDTLNDLYEVNEQESGLYGTFGEEEVIHIKGLTHGDSKRGVSVLSYARLAVSIADTGDRETQNRFANGGNVRGIVSNDKSVRGFGEYQDKQLEKTAENIDDRFQEGERIVSLPGQVDFKQISLSSTDMQFLESRKFTVREICRFFGVHPSFVFDDTSNNYKSAEQANVAFLSHTLAPLLRNIETELRRKLVSPSLSAKYKFMFDRRDLHACDLDGMMRYRSGLLQTGMTVNEVRKIDNLPPVEGGDTALVSANLRPLAEGNSPESPEHSEHSEHSESSENPQ